MAPSRATARDRQLRSAVKGEAHGPLHETGAEPTQTGTTASLRTPLLASFLDNGPVTTDFRAVLSELVSGHPGQKDLAQVFPGYKCGEPLGLLRG